MCVRKAPPGSRRGLVLLRRAAGFALATLAFMVPGPAMASAPRETRGKDVSGLVGVGFTSDAAPLGVRYLWSRRAGLDAGIGFRVESGGEEDRTAMVLEGAYLHALAPGRNVNFYLSPGVRFSSESIASRSTTTVRFFAALDVEYFLTDRVSLGARSGLYLESTSPPGGAGDRVNLGTAAGMLARAGFRAYLGGAN